MSDYLLKGKEINLAAYKLAREVADEGNALVSISLNEPTSVLKGEPKEVVQREMRRQIQFFIDENSDIDFVACEVRFTREVWQIVQIHLIVCS